MKGLKEDTKAALQELAAKSGLSPERLANLFIEAFVEGEGVIYSGPWTEGPGVRILIDWPRFSAKVYKLTEEEMK